MVYSRRIQWIEGEKEGEKAFVIPLPKKGDEGRFVDGMHVADEVEKGVMDVKAKYFEVRRKLSDGLTLTHFELST